MEETSLIKSGYAPINGLNMYYELHGRGYPLVLLHGGGSTIETNFGRILPSLAKTHRLIAVELQAHGHTSDRSAPESFEQDAADVAALLTYLDIGTADVLGFSNGGQTAMQLAMTRPEKVRKLVLGSMFYKREAVAAPFWDAMEQARFDQMPQALKDGFLKIPTNTAGGLQNMFNKDVDRMRNFKDWDDTAVKSIRAETLIIAGDADIMSAEHAVAMYRLIPNCRLAILPGGHGKYFGEVTTLINGQYTQSYGLGLLEEFLATRG